VHCHSDTESDILPDVSDSVIDISQRDGHEAAHGEMLAEISRSVVRLHKELYGKGPTKARSHMVGDVVLCLLSGGFTRAELTLIAGGKGELVRRQRDELQEIVRGRFGATIQSITGRPVLGFLSSIDEHAQLCCEIFVLEPRELDRPSANGAGASRDGDGASAAA
jgi:uncharacterized protein YbcI